MSPNKDFDSSKMEYFLPHHAVQKKDSVTTKLRVVFDGSCKPLISNSLNSVLAMGQVLQPDIFTILVRFRTVLSWLSSPPRNWKPFIANRTSEIFDFIPWNSWRYVPTKENPADIGSRGVSPKDLPDCRLWWEGSTWLSSPEADWPKQPVLKDSDHHVLKERKKSTFVFSVFLKKYY
ncbi:hypothetical protein AVEN_111308-1 [Araneus ventricosus]|uniref:Peptidase aspartic putative domain-containing protein n=1 Tax=Araneus ventricosus TaxID=182803 RepID=A0A4Y2GLI6_ARAVE|nr:hypothetical protein AVEN_111308-1 [Araneus ventricosus]